MGTTFRIVLYWTNATEAAAAAHAAFIRIAELENIMSDYQADSELMKLCDHPARVPVAVSPDLFTILEKAQYFSRVSDGAFDITVGPCVRLWRFSRKRKTLPSPEDVRAAKAAVGYDNVRLDFRNQRVALMTNAMRLDLGGIAKGYAADEALRLLARRGMTQALVAASGDIAVGDPPPDKPDWTIGITAIDTRQDVPARQIHLRNGGISTSGDTEQYIELDGVRYSHIVDPRTCLGLTNRIQVSVVAKNATTTDALATAVSVLGPARGVALLDRLPGVSGLILVKGPGGTRVVISKRFRKLLKSPGEQSS